MIRIVVAEDQGMLLGALCALLSLEDDLEVVGRGDSGDAAYQLVQDLQPDVLVTDIEMPGMSGLDLARRLERESSDCRVMILTTFARSGYFQRAMEAGVRAYLLKDAPSEELVAAIRRVMAGRRVIAPELAAENPVDADPLNDRERQCLRLADQGLRTGEIGERLFLSPGTVRNYLSEAIGKLQARNRIEAARVARQKGWL